METQRLEINWVVIRPLIFLIPGGLFAGVALIWLASHWLSAPGWASVEGQVVRAGVTSDTHSVQRASGRGTYQQRRYRADIVYHYQVGGRDYTGYGIGDGVNWNYPNYEGAAAAIARYNRGAVTVFYDPANPGRSALNTDVFGIVPLVLGGVGLVLLGIGFWLRRRGRAA